MSKRNRPTTAAQAAHRSRRHDRRSAYNSPEGKAARAAAGKAATGTKATTGAKPAAAPKPAAPAKVAAKPATPPPLPKT